MTNISASAPVMTMLEVANELRCSKAHVSNLINGKVPGVPALPSLSLGRRKLIRRNSFEAWQAACEKPLVTAILPSSINAVNA